MLCIHHGFPAQKADTEQLGNVSIAKGELSSVSALFRRLRVPTVWKLGAQGAMHIQPMHGDLTANSVRHGPDLKVSEPGPWQQRQDGCPNQRSKLTPSQASVLCISSGA